MQRLILFCTILLVAAATRTAAAKHPHHRSPTWRHPPPQLGNSITFGSAGFGSATFGSAGFGSASVRNFGYPYAYPVYGFGYYQDDYASGRFKIPDPLNDPIFRAQHKFDSHFPGRRYRRPRLQPTYPSSIR